MSTSKTLIGKRTKMNRKAAYLVDGIRTPIGNFRGSLSTIRTDDLASIAISALLERHPELDLQDIADLILGCANQAGEDNRNVARMAGLLAGLPYEVPGETINRLCASGMSASNQARRAIYSDEGDLFISGGVENMTRGPWVISKTSAAFGRDAQMYDSSFGWRFVNPKMEEMYGTDGMGQTAENLAAKYNISRADQDRFAMWSQHKAAKAQRDGYFDDELVPVSIPQRKKDPILFSKDEFIKPNTSLEVLSKLRPAFKKDGSVTAGNASGLNDGAAALFIASHMMLDKYSWKPLARILSSAVCGVEPRIMGIGPVPASKLALQRAGLSLDQMDIIELNEAFAVQVLSCLTEMGVAFDDSRINPFGGAIALGHPLGMTGARILLTAARALHKLDKQYALVSMCVGVGQGYACVIERV